MFEGLTVGQARPSRGRPGRVLLVGGDSIVSQAIQLYLRKEGYEIRQLPADPDVWPAGFAVDTRDQLVVVASPLTGARRAAICRRLRQPAAGARVPILALLDAGETRHGVSAVSGLSGGSVSVFAGAAGAAGANGSPATAVTTMADAPAPRRLDDDSADVSLGWPYRLREVLSTMEGLLAGRPAAASA